MSSGILMDFLNGPHSNSHEDCLNISSGGSFSKIYIKLSSVSLQSIGEKAVFVFSDSIKKDGGGENGNSDLESGNQIFKGTKKIWDLI